MAQEKTTLFDLLKISPSAHVAALGGCNVSLVDDDPTLLFFNPSLLASVSNNTLNLNYMSYLKDAKMGSASYVRTVGPRHTFGVVAQYLDYGSTREMDEEGIDMGNFSAKDIALSGLYSYQLTERWSGGATLRFLHSKYAEYSSLAMSVDVGLNYLDESKDFSFGIALRNVGAQLKKFDERREHLPVTLDAGISQGLKNAPFRISFTLADLTEWDGKTPTKDKKQGFGRKLLNHCVLGVDYLPTRFLYVSGGYNPRRAYELKASDGAHGAGFSVGGGLQLTHIKVGVAYAKYHLAESSLIFNFSYKI